MSSAPLTLFRRLALVAVLLLTSCGGTSTDTSASSTDTTEASQDEAVVEETVATTAPTEAVTSEAPAMDAEPSTDFELFASDEGAGCAVYIGVPEDAVDESTDVRALLWEGIVATEFTTCGFSEIVEVGLISVGSLDSYGQPDWSTVTEHGFFAVNGWDELIENCGSAPMADGCVDQVGAALS